MTFIDYFAFLSRKLISPHFIRNKLPLLKISSIHMDSVSVGRSSMELVTIPRIVSIYRHALHTFSESNQNNFAPNLAKLKSMMDLLKAEDLAFNSNLNNIETWRDPEKAPCTYIEVFQNDLINMSIFVLKPGFKMPLHDHPHMHGLLKVISGAVKIRSFSEHPLDETVNKPKFLAQVKMHAQRLAKGVHKERKFFAKVSCQQTCRATAETCILTPTISNYHEIQALEMPAAFFDILAPPYDTFIEDIGPRRCNYYKITHEISSNVVELQEIKVPERFYCDQAPYLGPILS